jgi:hypothetical protein
MESARVGLRFDLVGAVAAPPQVPPEQPVGGDAHGEHQGDHPLPEDGGDEGGDGGTNHEHCADAVEGSEDAMTGSFLHRADCTTGLNLANSARRS